ncbi:Flp family type IVb pilin [Sphingomonas bacterium]|uniref:Flp family type IVb pilin n=1 Tax=Sphingomonas bacterium TaxID=1895847 RepID=UPI0015771F08|nr:Flp family type IVb pilin [Sphingomonas bacterium]
MDVRSISEEPARGPARDEVPARGLPSLLRDRRGATAVEYGFVVALVVLAMFAALAGVGNTTTSMWNNINSSVTNAH